jgi:hypothetical protein
MAQEGIGVVMHIIPQILLLLCVLVSADAKDAKAPPTPDPQAIIQALKDDNELLRAQLAWATQELQIWQDLSVMQVRLNLKQAQERQKARETKAAAKAPPPVAGDH